jgi:hypothetical protein
MSEWPKYESHKIVQAAPIIGILEGNGDILVQVGDHGVESFQPTEPAMAKRAEIGGYAVIYEDGYKSVSPKRAFEEGYKAL